MPRSEFWQRNSPHFSNLAKNSPKLLQIAGKVAKMCSIFWRKIATSGNSAWRGLQKVNQFPENLKISNFWRENLNFFIYLEKSASWPASEAAGGGCTVGKISQFRRIRKIYFWNFQSWKISIFAIWKSWKFIFVTYRMWN